MDAGLRRDLENKIRSEERLDRQDALALLASDDLAWLGALAHRVRTRRHGDAAYFGEGADGADGAEGADGAQAAEEAPAVRTVDCGDPADAVDQLLGLRELQDADGCCLAVAPRCTEVTGAEALRAFAVTRLLLDNVPHVRVRWTAHGDQLAQLALQHGADDTDGPASGDAGPSHDELVDLIRDAGFRPVERGADYEAVRTYEGPDPERREAPQPMRL